MSHPPPRRAQLVDELRDPNPGFGRLGQGPAEEMAEFLRDQWRNPEAFEAIFDAEPSQDPGTQPPFLDPTAEALGVTRDAIVVSRGYNPIRSTIETQRDHLENPPPEPSSPSTSTSSSTGGLGSIAGAGAAVLVVALSVVAGLIVSSSGGSSRPWL